MISLIQIADATSLKKKVNSNLIRHGGSSTTRASANSTMLSGYHPVTKPSTRNSSGFKPTASGYENNNSVSNNNSHSNLLVGSSSAAKVTATTHRNH